MLIGKLHANASAVPRPQSRAIANAKHMAASTVAVPDWVPQLPTATMQQRFFRVATNDEHPEVAEVVRHAMHKLGWTEDRDGSALTSRPALGSAQSKTDVNDISGKGATHLWNMLWTWTAHVRVSEDELLMWQRVNHFQHCRCTCWILAAACAKRC